MLKLNGFDYAHHCPERSRADKFKTKILNLALVLLISLFVKDTFARERFFQVQSIDTMKYSRDLAREKLKDLSFDKEIDIQVKNIAETGATHVAIATPYDEEFYPYLMRWVLAARKYNLNVWFRGNWSGWENWFDYPKINRNIHISKTKDFIYNHQEIFENNDIFVSCPECENGGPGDPRQTGDTQGHRDFLIKEYQTVTESFNQINKKVSGNYFSMNGDVARLIMDKKTTQALDGAITIDHYVKNGDKLSEDIKNNYSKYNNRVILGEFGAPIPDINGAMTDKEQAEWIDDALGQIIKLPQVTAINYWTNKGSSTKLWDENNQPKQAVLIISKYFKPVNIYGSIKDDQGKLINGVSVKSKIRSAQSIEGRYSLPVFEGESILFSKKGYLSMSIVVTEKNTQKIVRNIILESSEKPFIFTIFYKLKYFIKNLLIF